MPVGGHCVYINCVADICPLPQRGRWISKRLVRFERRMRRYSDGLNYPLSPLRLGAISLARTDSINAVPTIIY